MLSTVPSQRTAPAPAATGHDRTVTPSLSLTASTLDGASTDYSRTARLREPAISASPGRRSIAGPVTSAWGGVPARRNRVLVAPLPPAGLTRRRRPLRLREEPGRSARSGWRSGARRAYRPSRPWRRGRSSSRRRRGHRRSAAAPGQPGTPRPRRLRTSRPSPRQVWERRRHPLKERPRHCPGTSAIRERVRQDQRTYGRPTKLSFVGLRG